jgi:hypothetical protein
MEEVNDVFQTIAASLNKESTSQKIVFKVNGGEDDGLRIRFSLDGVETGELSQYYIEGTFRKSGILENITYEGLSSTSGTTVSGTEAGVKFEFVFENIETDYTISKDKIEQWNFVNNKWNDTGGEFTPEEDSETEIEKKSSVVMLILDCTSSLDSNGANGFAKLKQAAKQFIETLVSNTGGGNDDGGNGNDNNLPVVRTEYISDITGNTAILYGRIDSAGTPAYTEKGFVYSTTASPTTADTKKSVSGSGTGGFNTTISGLTEDTEYYVRAYAINAKGTAYGKQVGFQTSTNEQPTTAQVRFNKEMDYTNVSAMAIIDGEDFVAAKEYGESGYGITDYSEIPSGELIPAWYITQEDMWYYAFESIYYNFQAGHKYTFGVGDDGQYLVFYIEEDGVFTSSDAVGKRQDVLRIPKYAIKKETVKATIKAN